MSLEPLPDDVAAQTAAYRQALGAFATGVCVVTADSAEGPLGITINSFTSVSLEPRLVLWCLDERSERWPVFAAAERFAIHVLPYEARDLAERFARGPCGIEDGEFDVGEDGRLRLPGALARLDCGVHQRLPIGDHMVIVGAVDTFESVDGPALSYFRGGYGRVERSV
jgi:flavin reductase (DIM6/NTAB) family NADH-FMN oxidoreductase RutF